MNFISKLDSNMKFIFIVLIVMVIITIINYILLMISNKRVKKYKKQYDECLAKFNSRVGIRDEFTSLYERLKTVEDICKSTVDTSMETKELLRADIQKLGLVKYNAYDETENKLSFALALLDANENGVLINHIYSKHGSSIYCKLVKQGKVEERISEEESTALREASSDKEFKERKTVETESLKISKANTKNVRKKLDKR